MSAARQSILDTAARLFAERGYELVGINEIIEKSDVAKATFYSHFRSKELLCVEWLRTAAAEALSRNSALLKDSASAESKIALKFDGLIEYINECDFRGCPFSITASMINPGSEVRQVIADYKAGARAFWQSLALEIRRDPEAARLLGDGLFLLFSGAVTEAQNARNPWPVNSAKHLALELCNSLQPA
jgi:AcrR family transcriptional regulator